jgi:hypothetical protein
MSIKFEPRQSASFEYAMNYSPSDFISTQYSKPSDCQTLLRERPCLKDTKTESCFNEELCKNIELSHKALNIINTQHEAFNRQYDETTIYERAIYNFLVMSGGILAMGATMFLSFRRTPLQ